VRSVLVISDRDNVATALEPLEPGQSVDVRGASIAVRDTIQRGHKIALAAIASGDAVIKYGSPIGVASSDIPAGCHVHTHNVSSGRGRGDLSASEHPGPLTVAPPGGRLLEPGRLAEPPDDRGDVKERAS
jgi:hypothetical protein